MRDRSESRPEPAPHTQRRVERPAFSVDVRVGRLVEARVFALRTIADADDYSAALVDQLRRVTVGAPVLLADHRPVVIYAQPVTQRLVELFLRMNTRLARVAIIASRTNATMAMQIERIVREANDTRRRVTYVPEDAVGHLGSALESFELQRAEAFLAEWSASP